jgi:hypothetical protein
LPLDLGSVHAKLGRAEIHANTLKDSIRRWLDRSPYRLERQRSADGSRHSWTLRVDVAPDFEAWSLIAADAIHNARSALDHLVYAIAAIQSPVWPLDERALKRLSFVIANDDQQWRADSGRKITPWIHADVVAAIRDVQCDRRQHAELPPLLRTLRDFDDFDKHRVLSLALSKPSESNVEFVTKPVGNPLVACIPHQGPFEDGTELMVVAFNIPQPDIQVKFGTTIAVTISHAAGPHGHTATAAEGFVDLMIEEVREVVKIVSAAVI